MGLNKEQEFLLNQNLIMQQTRQFQKLARQVQNPKCYVFAYLALNAGDDLFLHLLFNRYPNVTFFLAAAQPYTEIFKNRSNVICEVNRSSQHKFFDDFDGYDFAILIGGSMYQAHAIEGSFKRNVYFFQRFVKAGKPVFIIGSNFDRDYSNVPYNEKHFHELFQCGGNLMRVSLRDTHSYNLFRDLKNVTFAPDVVFSMEDNFIVPENKRNGLGISIISTQRETLKHVHEKYLNAMVSLIKSALERNIDVKIFSFCKPEGDVNMIEKIAQNLKDSELKRAQHVAYNGDIENFLRLFASMKYIVATRFHANVFALKFRQRLFPIVYNDKTTNLLEDLNIFSKDEFYDIRGKRGFDVQKVWRALKNSKNLTQKIEEWTCMAEGHFREVDKYLLSLPR